MTDLEKCRTDFCHKLDQYVSHPGERQRFAGVLDDFIKWSLAHSSAVQHVADYEQDVVAFKRVSDGAVLWSAFPKRADGAKFELLPGKAKAMPAERREVVLAVMQPLSDTPIGETSKLLAPFIKLKRSATRQQVKDLLDQLIVA